MSSPSDSRPELYVEGTRRFWQTGSLTVNQAINQRSTCDFNLIEADNEDFNAQRGSSVQVFDDNGVGEQVMIFNGVIERISRKAVLTPQSAGIVIEIQCVDVHYYIDKRIVTDTFENQSAGQCVLDLVVSTLHTENVYDHPYPGTMVAVARDDLLGYWRLAANPDDDSFWANTAQQTDGTDVNSPTYTSVNSLLGADFTASDASPVNDINMGGHVDLDVTQVDYIQTGRGADAFNLYASTVDPGFTVSAWVYDQDGTTEPMNAVSAGNEIDPSGNPDNIFQMRQDGTSMEFHAFRDSDHAAVTVTDPEPMPTTTWLRYTGVVDQDADEVRLYRNGILVDTATGDGSGFSTTVSGNPPVWIGREPGIDGSGATDTWDGFISEVAIVGRPLTTREVAVTWQSSNRSVLATVVQEETYFTLPLDEDDGALAEDLSAFNRTATYENAPGLGYTPALVPGGTAVDFDGGLTAVTVEGAESLFNQGVSITISAWIRPDDVSVAGQRIICEDDSSAVNGQWALSLGDPGAGELRFFIRGASTTSLDTASAPISNGTVHHVAATYNVNTGTRIIYVDGSSVVSDTVEDGGTFGDTGVTTTVANDSDFNSGFDGQMQHASVIPSALSGAEIEDIWLKGRDYYNANQPDLPATRVQVGDIVEEVVFNYVNGDKAMQKLAEVSEFEYFIDAYRGLHFHQRGASCCRASFEVTEANMLADSVDLLVETPRYRNRQYIKGGTAETTNEQVEQFTYTSDDAADDRQAFTVGFPLSREPTVEVDTGGGFGSPESIAIKGVEDSSNWFWSKGDATVTASDSRAGSLAAGDVIRISYFGQFPVIGISVDQDEIQTLLDIERAGTGRVENVVDERDVSSREQAFDLAGFLLQRFSLREQTINFTTRAVGLRPGQVVDIVLDRLDINRTDALIESVSFDDFNGIEFRYAIKAVTGPSLRGWEQFFAETAKKIITPQDQENISENEIVTVQASITGDTTTRSEPIAGDIVTVRSCVLLSGDPTLPFTLC